MKIIWHYLRSFVVVASVFFGGLYGGHRLVDVAMAEMNDPYSSLKTLSIVLHRIQNEFIEERPTEDLVHASVKGMVDILDEHSHYFPPQEQEYLDYAFTR